MRLILAFFALLVVAVAPLTAPALAATAPVEHCEEGHGKAPGTNHGQQTMDHQACCAAVDPGRGQDSNQDALAPVEARQRVMNDLLVASMASQTDPPPPRLG